jgi:hypothetical protein
VLAFLDLTGWLHALVSKMTCFVKAGIITAVNLIIQGLGDVWSVTVNLLPSMPAQPSVPSFVATGLAFAHWLVPWDFLVTLFEADVVLLTAWFAAAAIARWMRIVDS